MYRNQEQLVFARWLRNEPHAAEKLLWHFRRVGKGCVKFHSQGVGSLWRVTTNKMDYLRSPKTPDPFARISSAPVSESDLG